MANIYYDMNAGQTSDEEIEALIQQQLDALEDDVHELEKDVDFDDKTSASNEVLNEVEAYDKSISQYIDLIKYSQQRADETIVASQKALTQDDSQTNMDTVFAEKLKNLLQEDDQDSISLSDDLLQLRDNALKELEQNDLEEKSENDLIVAVYDTGLTEQITKLEEEESDKLQALLRRQEEETKLEAEKMIKAKEELLLMEKKIEEKAVQRQEVFERNQQAFKEIEKTVTAGPNQDSFLKTMEVQFKERIQEIENIRQKEEKEFLDFKASLEKERCQKRETAAVNIQKYYRSYRVRMMYCPKLVELKETRKRLQQEELDRIEAEENLRKKEEERKRREELEERRREKERMEKIREEQLKLEKEKAEKIRLEKEKIMREKLENERLEKLRLEEEKRKTELLRLEKEKEEKEKERLEKERLERLRLEEEMEKRLKLEKEKAEKIRLEKEKTEREKLENERLEKLRLEEEKRKTELLKLEKEKEKKEKERLEKERLERLRSEEEKGKMLKLEKEKKDEIRLQKEEAKIKKLELEKVKGDRVHNRLKSEKQKTLRQCTEEDKVDAESRLKRENEDLQRIEIVKKNRLSEGEEEKKVTEAQWKSDVFVEAKKKTGTIQLNAFEEGLQKPIPEDLRQEETDMGEMVSGDSCSGSKGLTGRLKEMMNQWLKEYDQRQRFEAGSQQEGRKVKSRPLRPKKSLETFPELDVDEILKALPKEITPSSCECISVSGITKIRMKGVQKFPKLRYIKMTDCGLEAVEDLESCDVLEKLELPGNRIDTVCISCCASLRHVILSGNMLSSTTGLEQLVNIEALDLSSNRITRIGAISSCKKLQRLNLNENQLISLKGLEGLQELVILEVARNYLGSAKEVEHLSLLTKLNLQGNAIKTIMDLKNQVLLQDLDLRENNITSLDPLEVAWLPSLLYLNVAGNSIEKVPKLDHLIMLRSIDLRDNVVRHISHLLPGMANCKRLSTLKISGNPVNDIPNLKCTLEEKIASLKFLDDIELKSELHDTYCTSTFEELCVEHWQSLEKISEDFQQKMRDLDKVKSPYHCELRKLEIEKGEREEYLRLLKDDLQKHVCYGKTPANSHENEQSSVIEKHNNGTQDVSDLKHSPDYVISESYKLSTVIPRMDSVEPCQRAIGEPISDYKETEVKISEEKETTALRPRSLKEDFAATKIQAAYRGHRVRRVLSIALESIRDDLAKASFDDDDDDFNYDEEVDLSAFDFDDGQEWRPRGTPQPPSRACIGVEQEEADLEAAPKHAWQSHPRTPEERLVEPLNLETSPEDCDRSSTVAETVTSKRKEEIVIEWGFQNSATADLMMKRMKKMNSGGRKKTYLGLAPAKRYELFKKLQQTQPNLTVRPPAARKTPNRVEYFAAQREMASPSNLSSASSEKEFRKDLTYSWVCSQAVLHHEAYDDVISAQDRPRDSAAKNSAKGAKDQVSLPYLDPAIIAGKPLPLVLMSSNVLSNQVLAPSVDPRRLIERGEQPNKKFQSKSAPNPVARTAPVSYATDSASSRSSSSEKRRRKKKP